MMHPMYYLSKIYIYKHIGKNHVSVNAISIGILSAFSIKMRKSVYQHALGFEAMNDQSWIYFCA